MMVTVVVTGCDKLFENLKIDNSKATKCPICMDTIIEGGYVLPCDHKVCIECRRTLAGKLNKGDVIYPFNYTCPICREVIDDVPNRISRILDDLDSNHGARSCTACGNIRVSDIPCSGDLESLPKYCKNCSWLEEKFIIAPCCGRPVIKDGGCQSITCECGKIWCWECGYILDDACDDDKIQKMNDYIYDNNWYCNQTCDRDYVMMKLNR